jgi:hypothetical protein
MVRYALRLNLLGAVSCKLFLRFTACLDVYLFLEFRICWPISADQPAAAAHLTENINVAFAELLSTSRNAPLPTTISIISLDIGFKQPYVGRYQDRLD